MIENTWISVADRLPQASGDYLVVRPADTNVKRILLGIGARYRHIVIARFSITNGKWNGGFIQDVTHWMPLPELPE